MYFKKPKGEVCITFLFSEDGKGVSHQMKKEDALKTLHGKLDPDKHYFQYNLNIGDFYSYIASEEPLEVIKEPYGKG